jgi:hypothetical protein
MALYYHASNFPDFKGVPETSTYTLCLASSLASLSEFNLDAFPGDKAYIHIFASDAKIVRFSRESKYIYRDGDKELVVATAIVDDTIPTDKEQMYHVGSMLVPITIYKSILQSYTGQDPHLSYNKIAKDIGNHLRRI